MQCPDEIGRPSQIKVAINAKQVSSHRLRNLPRAQRGIRLRHQIIFKLVQCLRPGSALVAEKMTVAARREPEKRKRRCIIERQGLLDQACLLYTSDAADE